MEDLRKNPMLLIEKLNSLCSENNVDTLEFIDDLKEFNMFQEMLKNKDVKRMYEQLTSHFYLNNGLFNRIDLKNLNDEQKTFIALITMQEYQPKNRFRQHILNYYFKNINEPIENINLKYIVPDFAKNYYAGCPGISAGLEKLKIEQPKHFTKSKFVKYIPQFIKIGESMQFNVKGFQKNQLLYLLFGICMSATFNKVADFNEHQGCFKSIINYIVPFIQINLNNKVFLSEDIERDEWSLITFLDFKQSEGLNGVKCEEIKHNFRYQCAKKYIKEVGAISNARNCFTKLIDDEKGTYLSTIYKIKDLKTLWDKFEELYLNKKFNELLNLWFDSQILTRSTCLIGCMLISLLNGKLIKFKVDEMPDWKAIIVGDFKGTYEEIDDLKNVVPEDVKDLTLFDVLDCLKTYIENIENI